MAGRGAEATIGRWFLSEASPAMVGRAITLFQSSSLLIPPREFHQGEVEVVNLPDRVHEAIEVDRLVT